MMCCPRRVAEPWKKLLKLGMHRFEKFSWYRCPIEFLFIEWNMTNLSLQTWTLQLDLIVFQHRSADLYSTRIQIYYSSCVRNNRPCIGTIHHCTHVRVKQTIHVRLTWYRKLGINPKCSNIFNTKRNMAHSQQFASALVSQDPFYKAVPFNNTKIQKGKSPSEGM